MYEEYFELKEKPFSTQPDPSFIYWARGHGMAYAMLEYSILNQASITVITGDIGCGKTTLIRHLLDELEDAVSVGLITNTMPGSGRILEWVLMSLGQPFESTSYVELYRRFHEFLIKEYARGSHTVLIVDEAQNFSIDELEELRMLSNINTDKELLFQLILTGQPQLRELLQHPSLTQFAQRVASDFHLHPLTSLEVQEYIDHRLFVAGAQNPLFSREACNMIFRASCGVPRVINILCDTALVYAYSSRLSMVEAHVVSQVLKDKNEFGVFAENKVPVEVVKLPKSK
jgi:general secretion pathway protein A